MTLPRERLWSTLTTVEAKALADRDPVVVLPLAAIEQHGPHLPISTDVDIGEGVLAHALERLELELPVRVLPTIAFGASEEHAGFPGTITVSASELARRIRSVGLSLAGAGVRRLVLANSHGGNRASMATAALKLRREVGMLVVKASYPRFPRPEGVDLPEAEWRYGIHGGAVETSMMSYLRSEDVHSDAIRDWGSPTGLFQELGERLSHLRPEGYASFGWLAEDLDASGLSGDPRLASAEMGERLVRHYGRILAEIIHDAVRFPLERLAMAEGTGVEAGA